MDKTAKKWRHILTEDWQRRLTALFTLIFLLQYVSWFASEEYLWWPETVMIVRLSLIATFALELLPKVNAWLLRCVQIWILIGANAMFSNYKPVFYKVRSLGELSDLIYDNFWQLHPFIWFSLGAWLIYIAASWWMSVRWRIGVATVVSVLVLASRDSFSLLTLWDETAIIIFCGLMLLVVCHFGEIKRQNPTGWTYLAEYPITLLATIFLLVGAAMLPGTLMPSIRPLLTDPYTAYLHWKGEEAPAFGKGLISEIFPSSGNPSSGYSRDDSSLGGGFDYDYAAVFSVETTHRNYWRGETRASYTGNGWQASEGDSRAASVNVAVDGALNGDSRFDTSLLQTIKVRQSVQMLSEEESYPVLFGAFSISKVESINGEKLGSDRLSWLPRQAELRWSESRRESYPQAYTIESDVPIFTDDDLLAVADPPNLNQLSEYLQLPRSLPDRVRELALEVTAEGDGPYEKARLLEEYLRTTYPYTNKPREELGKSEDFVDRFLFEIKEGYCDYFSSAMAVMSRTLNIPSRWVKGYVSGYNEMEDVSFGQVPLDLLNDPDEPGTYTVRNSDAHSWVELYFHGYGWIPFEPTSGFVLPAYAPEEPAEETVVPEELPATEPPVVIPDEPEASWSRPAPFIFIAIGALLLLLLGAGWFFRERLPAVSWRGKVIVGKRTVANPRQRIVSEYGRLMRVYRRRGFPVHDHETARETIVRLKQKNRWMEQDLDHLLILFEKAKYSPRSVTHEECGRVIEIVDKLKKAI